MAFGVGELFEEHPSATHDLVCTGLDVWRTQISLSTRQNNLGLVDVLHLGDTTLKLDVDVQHVAFADRCDVHALFVALLVVILVNHGDNLLG